MPEKYPQEKTLGEKTPEEEARAGPPGGSGACTKQEKERAEPGSERGFGYRPVKDEVYPHPGV